MLIPRHPPKQVTCGKLTPTGAPDLGFWDVLRGTPPPRAAAASAEVCTWGAHAPRKALGAQPRLPAWPSKGSSARR